MTGTKGRRRRALLTAITARLGDLERYGLLALVAALLLGVACLAQALGGNPAPIRAMAFQGPAAAAATAPHVATSDAPKPDAPKSEAAPPAVAASGAAAAPVATDRAAPPARPGFDFFEPPVRLPGKPPVVAPLPPERGEAATAGASDVRLVPIRKGDTLQKIAARELGSANRWRSLVDWNPGLDPKRLPAGGQLKIKTARREAPVAARKEVRQHEVARDDTLQSIAQRYLGDRARWIDLLEANRDQLRDPSSLRAGMKIRIP